MLIIFLAIGTAIIAACLAFAVVAFVSYKFSLAWLGLVLCAIIPAITGTLTFVWTLRRLRTYLSN